MAREAVVAYCKLLSKCLPKELREYHENLNHHRKARHQESNMVPPNTKHDNDIGWKDGGRNGSRPI
jgi:hypothetical protein